MTDSVTVSKKHILTLVALCDPELRPDPSFTTIARVVGLPNKFTAREYLNTLIRNGYLDEDRKLTDKGKALLKRVRPEYKQLIQKGVS